jgi:hypothetical protein
MCTNRLQKRRGSPAVLAKLRHVVESESNVRRQPRSGRPGVKEESAPRSIAPLMLPKKPGAPVNRHPQPVVSCFGIALQQLARTMPRQKPEFGNPIDDRTAKQPELTAPPSRHYVNSSRHNARVLV